MSRIAMAHSPRSAQEFAIARGRAPLECARALLGQSGLFRQLGPNERTALFAHARLQKYAAADTIFRMGSPGDSMLAVLNGSIRISVLAPNGKEVVLAILGPGNICGEIALLDGKARTADARAATDCSVVVLERRDVLAFFAQYPEAWAGLADVLCERLRVADQQMAEFALSSVSVRLARALLRLAIPDTHAASGAGSAHVDLTQRELGNFIGATRETVNKRLRSWEHKGYIRLGDRLIVITNRAAVESLVDPDL
jgi:CRP/FNR family transcriptional regulator, cyclic AMP receptor protein